MSDVIMSVVMSFSFQDAGRLLYLGQNEWAHVNCSMWSAEVFEEDNGSLLHVHSAVARGRLMVCFLVTCDLTLFMIHYTILGSRLYV